MSEQTARIWLLLALTASRAAEERASAYLFDLGANGVVTLSEEPKVVTLGAYFNSETSRDELDHAIREAFEKDGCLAELCRIETTEVPDQDWLQKWKEGFEPSEIGERLLVAPSWRLPEETKGRVVLQIDPGMAFGTGTHETTRMCLELIEQYWRGGTLLDVGTGTGILAIAAALLQRQSRVLAIDVDPQAVSIAARNVAVNDVTRRVDLATGGPAELAGQRFCVVVANLTAEVIVDLLPELCARLDPAGWMILSGILSDRLASVEAALSGARLDVVARREEGEWRALVASCG